MAFEHFYLALLFIAEVLEIINDTHAEMGSLEKKYTESWDYKKKRKSTSLLNAVTFFEFIISLIGLHRLLYLLSGITNCLQRCGFNIIEAYDDVSSVIKDIKSTRKNIDK